MSSLKVYENIRVSGVDYNFSRHPHESIPPRLFADWAALTHRIAKAVDPAFSVPDLPGSFEFTTETIHSDDPYRSDENYYILDFVYFDLIGSMNQGIRISFENGRLSGDDPVQMDTIRYSKFDKCFLESYIVSSQIPKAAESPLATFYVWHDEEKTSVIENIFLSHREFISKSDPQENR